MSNHQYPVTNDRSKAGSVLLVLRVWSWFGPWHLVIGRFGIILLFAAQSLQGATNTVASTNSTTISTNAPKPPKPITTPAPKPWPTILRGPYLQCGTTNSMVVRWRTDIPAASAVRYGLSATNLNKKTNTSGSLTEHVVLLSGLKPDTKYYYSLVTPDCPILATLSNNTLRVSATNSSLAVSAEKSLQLASVTNQTLILSAQKNKLMIGNPQNGRLVASSNSVLTVSTSNNWLLVRWTN